MPIQPINHGSTVGYQVRVGPRSASVTRFFALRKYGGARKALAQAKLAEIELRKTAEPTSPRKGPRSIAASNNTSGLVGIRPRYVVFSDTPYLYIVASWSKDGRACSTSFSAERHGLVGAIKLAIERRTKATGVACTLTPRQALNRMKHLLIER
jgi:hypothetical protein